MESPKVPSSDLVKPSEVLAQKKAEYLALALSDDEKELVNAAFNKPLKDEDVPVVAIVPLIGELRAGLGAMKDVDKKQIAFEAQHVIRNFHFLSKQEILLAFQMFLSGRLRIGLQVDFVMFNNFLVTKILLSFSEYRVAVINGIDARKPVSDIAHKPTPKEKAENMRYFIEQVYIQLLADTGYLIFADTVYRYLVRTKQIVITQEAKDHAREYAHKRFTTASQKETKTIANIINSIGATENQKEASMRNLGYEYHLRTFFKDKVIDDILKDVKEKQFTHE